MRQTLFLALTLLCLLSACQQTKSDSEQTSRSGAFSSHSADTSAVSRIVASGELIVTTLSGPDTYYDYQGQEFGVQFALAQRFAASLGVGIRVEVASDTLTLVNHVLNGDADLIALQLPESFAKSHGLRPKIPLATLLGWFRQMKRDLLKHWMNGTAADCCKK